MIKDFIDEILDNLFTEKELSILKNVTEHTSNVEKLKELGEVNISKTEQDGFVIEKLSFKSNDGNSSFTQEVTYENTVENCVQIINEKIAQCICNEDYEKAATFKKEREKLLNKSL